MGFSIATIDLQEVLAKDGVVGLRSFIGLGTFTNSDIGKKITEEKLMIVGIDKNEKDMISTKKRPDGKLISAQEQKGYIYDLTRTCPTNFPK